MHRKGTLVGALLWLSARVVCADPLIGDAAPVTSLPDGHGQAVALAPPPGGVLLVDFFATWCGPCHEAIAVLSDELRASGARVRLVIVDEAEDPALVEPYFASHPLPPGGTVVYDRDGTAARAWGQHRFPTTFFMDAQGVIRHINRGYGPGYPARAHGWLASMLRI